MSTHEKPVSIQNQSSSPGFNRNRNVLLPTMFPISADIIKILNKLPMTLHNDVNCNFRQKSVKAGGQIFIFESCHKKLT